MEVLGDLAQRDSLVTAIGWSGGHRRGHAWAGGQQRVLIANRIPWINQKINEAAVFSISASGWRLAAAIKKGARSRKLRLGR